MSSHRTSAESTVAILQDAAQRGVPVLIPGANESRASNGHLTPTESGPDSIASALPLPSHAAADRGQLEHQREGGGAPSERQTYSEPTGVARLFRWLLRGRRG